MPFTAAGCCAVRNPPPSYRTSTSPSSCSIVHRFTRACAGELGRAALRHGRARPPPRRKRRRDGEEGAARALNAWHAHSFKRLARTRTLNNSKQPTHARASALAHIHAR
jgi:hypothetical protein